MASRVTHPFLLKRDVDAGPWDLLANVPFQRSIGIPDSPQLTIREGLTPKLRPGTIVEPLRLDFEGRSEATLITYRRFLGDAYVTDLMVSLTLERVLLYGTLPRHAMMTCDALVFPAGSFGVLPKKRKPKGPFPFRWIWWEESFDGRLDPQRSRFRLRYRDGTTHHASYESLDDLRQVQKRAADTLEFDIRIERLAWCDPSVDVLDVVPLGPDVYLSERMANRVREAALPGVKVAPLLAESK
jgi:hypothetical protein